jgi:hypothetical protein
MAVFYSRLVAGALCALFFAASATSIWKWPEFRGVYDDICYLRQAHVFQRFGIAGLYTDISLDDDGAFSEMQKAIGYPGWADPKLAPCHSLMPKTGKRVIQYPPGPGFALSLFPHGIEARGLYIFVGGLLLLISLLAIRSATTVPLVALSGAIGSAAIYFMVNPAKASYSMAPTMLICALAGYLTSGLPKRPTLAIALLGLCFGLAVDFRLANAFLSAGCVASLVLAFVGDRSPKVLGNGVTFALTFMLGAMPTLAANWLNAGSPFATTYSGGDTAPPVLSIEPLMFYLTDLQGALVLLALAWAARIILVSPSREQRQVAMVTVANIVANGAFFLSHAIYTSYYLMPVAMLSLWTLAFASLRYARPQDLASLKSARQRDASLKRSAPK